MHYLINKIDGGYLMMVADDGGIVQIALGKDEETLRADVGDGLGLDKSELASASELNPPHFLQDGMKKLTNYLNGLGQGQEQEQLQEQQQEILTDLRLRLVGTDFQQLVWKQLIAIPFGLTVTYGRLARALGTHPRAIGGACAANKLAVVIPCHRVVPGDTEKSANPAGHYRWGTEWKQRLLQMEATSRFG